METMWLHLFRLAGTTGCGTQTGVLPSIYDGLCANGSKEIKITSVQDLVVIIANVTRIGIMIAGGLAIILLLVASIYFITSTGDPGRTKRARDIIQTTVIGLIIIIGAYAVVTFIAAGL